MSAEGAELFLCRSFGPLYINWRATTPSRARLFIAGSSSLADFFTASCHRILRSLFVAVLLTVGLIPGLLSYSQEEDEPKPGVATRSPQLASVFPMGARPGSLAQVELRGEFLDRAERAIFDRSDCSARIKSVSFSRILLEVRVSSEAQPGPHYFRVITPRGASNLLLFRISAWPSMVESEPNHELQNLPLTEWPVLINGRLESARDVDLFRFEAKAGQRLSLHVLGARNWSTADLSLALLDTTGRAVRQDEGSFIWDPYIDFTCAKDGDYVAAITLTRMPAGGQSRTDLTYQLAIGPVPLMISGFPLYLQSGSNVRLRVRGEFLDLKSPWIFEAGTLAFQGSEKQAAGAPAVPAAGTSEFNWMCGVPADTPDGAYFLHLLDVSGLVPPLEMTVGKNPAGLETGKNDDMGTAQPVSIPVTINGKIESNWDEDFYRFEATAGDALVFRVDAEKYGSRLDARLTLLDSAGKTLAVNDDAKVLGRGMNWDPELEYTFKERGIYYIKVSSLQRRGGEDYVYALTMRRQAPDFALSLGSERLSVTRGGKSSWNVTVQRREGFRGDVIVEVQGLPGGVGAKPIELKNEQTTGRIEIVAAAEATVQATPVKFVGRATVGGRELSRVALIPAARITGSGPGFFNFRSTVGWVSTVEPPLFSLESSASEVFVVRGGTAEFGVKIARGRGFRGDPEFTLENLPKGVTLENVEIIDEGRLARLTVRASETAVVGRAPDVTLVGTGNHEGTKRSESAPRINLQVD